MSIQAEYYLTCDKCYKLYGVKCDDPQGTEDEAIDDGWQVLEDMGTDGRNDILSTHICDTCLDN